MISPRPRLIFWTATLLIPLALVAAAQPSFIAGALILAGIFLLFVVSDALMSLGRLDGIHVSMPDVIRLTKEKEGDLDLTIENDTTAFMRLRLGIAFPPEFRVPSEEVAVALPHDAHTSHISLPCVALKRGNYVLENVYMETNSALGLWGIRKVAPAKSEVRVYPSTMHEQRNLAGLFLNRGMFGVHPQRQIGKGREFEKLREYIPGDSFDDIHWKATAKRNHPITKVFQIERTQEVYVVIDASRLSGRTVAVPSPEGSDLPPPDTSQLERFITAALVLGLVAEKQGDLFGMVAFNDQIRSFVRARNGKAHYGACRDALYSLEPKLVNPDFTELCSFIRLRIRRRALLIFLTNLDDPVLAESFLNNIDIVARHHLVLVNVMATPDMAPLFSDSAVASTDDVYRRLGGHMQWQKIRELQRVLKHRGVSASVLDNEKMCPQIISQYISVKRRQLL
jgi:uncharacterized protein (DUF58 family)